MIVELNAANEFHFEDILEKWCTEGLYDKGQILILACFFFFVLCYFLRISFFQILHSNLFSLCDNNYR